MNRLLLYLAILALVYVLALDRPTPWDLLMGALVAGALLFLLRRPLFGEGLAHIPGLAGRIVALVPFIWAVIHDITVGAWNVALVVLHLRPLVQPGIVTVPMEDRTPTGVVVTTLVTTLSPGTFLVDLNWADRTMLFHYMDARDPEAIRSSHRQFYRRYQRQVFP